MEAASAAKNRPHNDHLDDDCVFIGPEDGEFHLLGDRIRSDAVNTKVKLIQGSTKVAKKLHDQIPIPTSGGDLK